jgi:bifunctional non-homologous end joining protein LigD
VRAHLPRDRNEAMLVLSPERRVRLTNLRKPFWPELGVTKAMLIQYYLDVAPVLLPHLEGRAMVMKRYPNGVAGKFFFMKRAPVPRPPWVRTCTAQHPSGTVIEYPVVDDVATLAWVINLGCIDLNPFYAR